MFTPIISAISSEFLSDYLTQRCNQLIVKIVRLSGLDYSQKSFASGVQFPMSLVMYTGRPISGMRLAAQLNRLFQVIFHVEQS